MKKKKNSGEYKGTEVGNPEDPVDDMDPKKVKEKKKALKELMKKRG